ncbi:MAG TPA: LysE family transporter [Cyclobacteriaceae bacterium]|nr:LysE family transporter [Cytophagales bacterium]HRE66716.1 LysE family transporter [Cyclobacteriaceae bacterium]HRF33530.1 LysE family transporter [Cyclobacteriaceae bacterium]
MEIVLNGIKMGLVLAVLVGPVFFTIMQTSVERGFWSGVLVSLGVSVSDILFVTICYFGLVQFIHDPEFKEYLAYVGAVILMLFGLYHAVIKSRRPLRTLDAANEKSWYRYFFKGFVINALSPMVPVFWIGAISVASLDFGYTQGYEFLFFFCVVLITVLATDLIKAYLADKLRRLVTQRLMMILNIVVGICLFAFGIRLWLMAETFLQS